MIIKQEFLPQLKDCLLGHLLGHSFNGNEHAFSDNDWNTVSFVNNQIYCHKVICINYTSYDICHAQDSLNPQTHADIMVLSHKDEIDRELWHPYWYTMHILLVFSMWRSSMLDQHQSHQNHKKWIFCEYSGLGVTWATEPVGKHCVNTVWALWIMTIQMHLDFGPSYCYLRHTHHTQLCIWLSH